MERDYDRDYGFEMGDEYEGDDDTSEDCTVEFEQGLIDIDVVSL